MNVKTKRNQQKCKDDKKTDECDVDRCKKLAVDARLKNRLYNRFKHLSCEILLTVRLALGKYWPGVPRAQTPWVLTPFSLITHHVGHTSLTCSARLYHIFSNNSRGRLFEGGDYVKDCSSESSLRGRRWKGKGKGEFARARGRKLPSSLLPRAWCRALISFPFPFERLPRRLHWKSCPNYFVLFSKKKNPIKETEHGLFKCSKF